MIKAYFRQERETKGAIRYQEINVGGDDLGIGEGCSIGTLYIRKTALQSNAPRIIAVVIDEIDLDTVDD